MRTVIVTGASKRNWACDRMVPGAGFRTVVPVARSSEAVSSAAATIREIGAEALPIIQDTRQKGAADRVVGTVMAATGRIALWRASGHC